MSRVVIGLGSNIDPERYMTAAFDALSKEFVLLSRSGTVRTAPVGPQDQPDYLNAVVLIETGLSREALKSRLKALESSLGRQVRPDKWGPREIDLDILIWDGQVINTDYYERGFLQKAVAELLADIKRRCC